MLREKKVKCVRGRGEDTELKMQVRSAGEKLLTFHTRSWAFGVCPLSGRGGSGH